MAERRMSGVAFISKHLQEKLGPEGAEDLASAIAAAAGGVKDQVMELIAERMERRFAETRAELERKIVELGAVLRQEMAEMKAQLRQEMAEMKAQLRQEMAGMKADLIKWAFIFWVTQMTALAGIVALLLRR